ncbi:MAG: NupC/NupG family nucleoside CNT transporter [Clostridia bacterium]|nr:NupC/NupG family nucleoside CNT transporter [Deltaproteobacteria bacterium]
MTTSAVIVLAWPAADAQRTDDRAAPQPVEQEQIPDRGPYAAYCGPQLTTVPDVRATYERAEALVKLGQLDTASDLLCAVIGSGDPRLTLLAHEKLRRVFIDYNRGQGLADLLAQTSLLALNAGDRNLAARRLQDLIAVSPQHPDREHIEKALGLIGKGERTHDSVWSSKARSFLGVFVLLGIAFAMSVNRQRISWRLVIWGMALQLIFAVLVLVVPYGKTLFSYANDGVNKLIAFTDTGASFVFGSLYEGVAQGKTHGPLSLIDGTSGDAASIGIIFAFHILPTIIFFGALMSVLYHWGIIQRVVHAVAWVMKKSMRTSGSESFAAAVNIFVGQTEAPLAVKPYLAGATMSELMAIMVGGFSSVAGGVLAAYVRFGIDAGHLIAASVMSAPASLVIAKIMWPETEKSETAGGQVKDPERTTANVIDAAAAGASDGLLLALNVAAMLIAFIALIACFNWLLGMVCGWLGFPGVQLGDLFGWAFYPLSWCMGVDTSDLLAFGKLMGMKISLNEFVAYIELGAIRHQIAPRTFTIATYALCGFANFSSIGIQIGGISSMAPARRSDLAKLGFRAMIAGAITTSLMACIAGLLI